MAWIQLIITAQDPKQAARITQILETLALAVTQNAGNEQEIFEPDLNTTPLWQQTQITALFDEEVDRAHVMQTLHRRYPASQTCDYHFEAVADQAWERTCLDDFQAIDFGHDLWICPSWLTPPNPNACNIILDPGLAFGTGTHPTTHLCLQWIAASHLENKTVIDYGCGSGILAIACAMRGAKRVYATDIDIQAIEATVSNCERNQLPKNAVTAVLDTELPVMKHDIVIANILALPLITLAKSLAAMNNPGGQIVLSGILREQSEEVLAAYAPWYHLDPPIFLDDWTRITGNRR